MFMEKGSPMTAEPRYRVLKQPLQETQEESRELRLSDQDLTLLKAIAASSNEAVAVSDATGKLVYINPAHETLFGRSLKDAAKCNWRDDYPPESFRVERYIYAAV